MTDHLNIRRIALWLALSACLATAVTPAAGLTLCEHPDGGVEFGVGDDLGCPCDHESDSPDDEPGPCDDLIVGGWDGPAPTNSNSPDLWTPTASIEDRALFVIQPDPPTSADPGIVQHPQDDPPAMQRLLDIRRATVLLI